MRLGAAAHCRGLVALLAIAGCAPEVWEWHGDRINAIELGSTIITADDRIILDGKDYGPFSPGDHVRLTRSGRDLVLSVNGEVRAPTGRGIPESLFPRQP